MAAEEIFELLDSYWFEHEIFSKKVTASPQKTNPVLEIEQEVQEPNFSSLPSLHVRSLSDHALVSCKSSTTSFSSDHSLTPKLQTIASGKEVTEFAGESVNDEQQEEMEMTVKPKRKNKMKKKKKKKSSKSLSDLEFEELKGFMDLGFVFSEKDKDSSLVSIIPGLQRLRGSSSSTGEDVHDHEEIFVNNHNNNKPTVSRPYLSEAWAVLDHQTKVENSLMNWRIPSLGNEVNIKDQLRFWAHTVASTVR